MMKTSNKFCARCKDFTDFAMPDEIVNEIHDVVFFVGAGVSTESKRAFPDTLYRDICAELKIKLNKNFSFPQVMSLYVKKCGSRAPLINKIRERFDYFESWPELYSKATEFHNEIATFPCISDFVTTNWDNYLETEAKITPFVYDKDIPFWNSARRRVLKIHGSINDLGSLIATEEDYKECYKKLNSSNIGSKLKLFIAQNIIVFLGYSFQDYDFQRIYKYISKNTGDFKRQAYIVTLDKSNEKNWLKYQLKPIYTEGSHFVHELKIICEKNKCLLMPKNMAKVFALHKYIALVHDRTSKKYSHTKFPDIIYCLSYQDGILHALEYLTNKVKGGTSLCTKYLLNSIHTYEELVVKYKKNWLDHSYLEGYLVGIYLFNGAMFSDIKLKDIPVFCYYNEVGTEKFLSEREFATSLRLISKNSKKSHKAKNFIKKQKIDDSVVFHHIPRI